MSLKVWLPLTEDTKNQGLLNLPTPWDARTRDTGGKLGQYCYSDNAIYHIENEWLGNEWSLACWVKSSSWGQYNDIILCKNTTSSGDVQFYFSIIGGTWLNISCNSGGETLKINYAFDTNIWYHIAATYDGTTLKLYLNGNEIGTKAYTSTQKTGMNNLGIGCRSTNAAGTSATGGSGKRMNDVRIYDHALSPLEVKHISQGLILHYPLNNNGWGQENLLKDSKNLRNSKNTYIYWPFESEAIEEISGKICTISFDAKSTTNNVACDVYFRSDGGMVGSSIIVSNIMTNYKRFNITMVAPTSTFVYICIRNNGNVSGASKTATYSYKNIKVELGLKATPWCPNKTDELYNQLGVNNNILYDTSGYKNNGTRTGTFSWTGDTPRYNVSTVFNGTERIKRDTLDGEIYTLACWAKTTKNKSTSQQIIADSKSEMTISFYKGTIIGVFGTTRGRGSKSILGSSYKENNWNHFVVVKTGTSGERAIYCNGVLLTPTSNDYWGAASGFFVGAKNDSQGNPFYGQICDVRAYATALSAEDILSLYNNSAYIDNLGNIYGAIYEEV